jgi:hypothetical protein
VLRGFSSAKPDPGETDPDPRIEPRAGLNRFVWDLRHESIPRLGGLQTAGGPGAGYRVPPGDYEVRLTVGDVKRTQPLEVRVDPRTNPSAATIAGQQELLADIHGSLREIRHSVRRLRSAREQINGLEGRIRGLAAADTVRAAAARLLSAIDSVEALLVNAKAKTFQDVINFRNGLSDQLLDLAGAIDGADAPVTQGMRDRHRDLRAAWQALRPRAQTLLTPRLDEFNALVRGQDIPTIVVPR